MYGPYVKVLHDPEEGDGYIKSWYPDIYVDLNKDHREDALITLANPGSGEYGTGLMFLQTPNGPKSCGSFSGGHFFDTVIRDTIQMTAAHYLDQDPDCCERAQDVQRIVRDGDSVRFLPLQVLPAHKSSWLTVSIFYAALSGDFGYVLLPPDTGTSKEYAYSMFSKSYHDSHPYKKWLSGFAHTLSIKADVNSVSPDSAVSVKVTSKDTINGRTITKHYVGIWHMKFITNNLPYLEIPKAFAKWVLDRPEIREVEQ